MARIILTAVIGLALMAGLNTPSARAQSKMTTDRAMSIVFDEVQKRLIRDYFGEQAGNQSSRDQGRGYGKGKRGKKGRGKGMPPGLARKGQLPPGLQKQLQRNGTLPPGLAKRQLPPGLSSRLGPLPYDTERYVVDSDVILIRKSTGIILDVLHDVLSK